MGQVTKKNEENKGMQIRIESVDVMLNEKNEIINISGITLKEHEENIKQYLTKENTEIEAQDKEMQIQKNKINTQNIENETMSKEINHLTNLHLKIKGELTFLKKTLSEKENSIADKQEEVDSIKAEKQEDVDYLKETVTKKERLIENLHASLKEANEKLNTSAQPNNDRLVENDNTSDHSLEVFKKLAAATNESLESVCTLREEERNELIQVLGIRTDNKGDERLQVIEERMEVERQRLRETEERLREEKERLVCIVCSVEEVGMVFSPCGHVTCCTTCAPRVASCPTCRAKVVRISRVYIK